MAATVTEKLKNEVIKYAKFLNEVYTSDTAYRRKRVIGLATEDEVDTLLWVLHHFTNSNIPVKRQHFDIIVRSKRLVGIKRFVKYSDNFKNKSLKEKKKFLIAVPCYRQLMHSMFHL